MIRVPNKPCQPMVNISVRMTRQPVAAAGCVVLCSLAVIVISAARQLRSQISALLTPVQSVIADNIQRPTIQ